MKKFLLASTLLVSSVGMSQVVEDFEGVTAPALPTGWTQVTNATDGGYASTADISSQYFAVASHTNYVGTNDDVCNCDKAGEKLVSAAVAIPATGADLIQFEYALGMYYGEFANFGISTDGGTTVTDLGLLATTRVGTTSDHAWETASFSLAGYAGQTVNFVWTYDDNADWGSGLAIDDVEMISIDAVDMEMTAITNAPTVVAGAVTIEGTVTSLGADPVASYEVTWNDGTGAQSSIITPAAALNYGDSDNFSHTVDLNATAGTTYNLDVTVIVAGDAVAGNNTISTVISAVSSIPTKVTVGEEKTGEWCGWCPRGGVALAEMELSNPDDFIGIAVHNGDGMVVSSYDSNIGTYVPGGYPGGGVDRVVDGDPSTFAAMHAQRVSMVAPASISVTKTYDGTNVTVEVEATFVGGLSGDYRLAAVLTEDNVSGAGQANYYNDGGAGALAMPNTGSMANFDFVGGGATVTPYYHDHTARALGGDEINGVAGSLPATINAGDVLSYTYTIPQDAAWVMDNVHAVGMLVNGSTGEILNAGAGESNSINEVEANNFNAIAAPNPTSGMSNLIIDLEVAADVAISVKNVLGQEVFVSNTDKLSAGSYTTAVDLSNEPSGVYFAKVVVNGQVQIVKINVAK